MEIKIKNETINEICPFCKNEKSKLVAQIDKTPRFLGCTDRPKEEDQFIDFQLFECDKCYLIFTKIITESSDYSELHSEAVGGIWKEHHETLAKYIEEKSSEIEVNRILEIGPSSSPLTRLMSLNNCEIVYCDMIEKLPFELKENEKYVQGEFPNEDIEGKFDIIFASHVFEHALDTEKFLQSALDLLTEEGKFIISIPNFEHWIGQKFWNGITPEHTIYPFVSHINQLAKMKDVGFEIQEFKKHSIFFTFEKSRNYSEIEISEFFPNLAEKWCESILDSVKEVEVQLEESSKNAVVFSAGASHLSQYPILMSEKLREKIAYVIDNSDTKVDKRLYGTEIKDKKFEFIADYENPIVIVFSSPYQSEMIKQIESINSSAKIIKP